MKELLALERENLAIKKFNDAWTLYISTVKNLMRIFIEAGAKSQLIKNVFLKLKVCKYFDASRKWLNFF